MTLLETSKKQFKISLDGYHRPTPVVLKYIADFVIFTLIPAGDAIIASMPDFNNKEWMIVGWTAFCLLFKAVTKFVSEFPKANEQAA